MFHWFSYRFWLVFDLIIKVFFPWWRFLLVDVYWFLFCLFSCFWPVCTWCWIRFSPVVVSGVLSFSWTLSELRTPPVSFFSLHQQLFCDLLPSFGPLIIGTSLLIDLCFCSVSAVSNSLFMLHFSHWAHSFSICLFWHTQTAINTVYFCNTWNIFLSYKHAQNHLPSECQVNTHIRPGRLRVGLTALGTMMKALCCKWRLNYFGQSVGGSVCL